MDIKNKNKIILPIKFLVFFKTIIIGILCIYAKLQCQNNSKFNPHIIMIILQSVITVLIDIIQYISAICIAYGL